METQLANKSWCSENQTYLIAVYSDNVFPVFPMTAGNKVEEETKLFQSVIQEKNTY